MTVNVRIIEGEEEGTTIYDLLMDALPRQHDTITMRMPDRKLFQYLVTRVDFLIDVKLGVMDMTNDTTAVRVYVQAISPAHEG